MKTIKLPSTYSLDLFDYEESSSLSSYFYNATLKVSIDKFPIGSKFKCVYLKDDFIILYPHVDDVAYYQFAIEKE